MTGISLSAEQILHAPPEVRQWLEREIARTLGLNPVAPTLPTRHLVGCTIDVARAIVSAIGGALPVVIIFFELAREPVARSPQGWRALRLDEMGRHAHMQTTQQVVAALRVIDGALQRASGDPDAAVTAVDSAGYCLVADVTARSIRSLWQEFVACKDLVTPDGLMPQSTRSGVTEPNAAAAPPTEVPTAGQLSGLE